MALKSKKKLFAFLSEHTGKEITLNSKGISDETYGKNSCIYIQTESPESRRRLEQKLKENGFKINENYAPGSGSIEANVSYFKGWHWDE